MKDQVIMLGDGDIGVATSLFAIPYDNLYESSYGFAVKVDGLRPLAYIVSFGDESANLVTARFLEDRAMFLGEL